MVGKTKAPTKSEHRRMRLLKTEVGCVACRLEGLGYEPPDIHHLLSGGRRIGHSATVPLCPWHHRGQAPERPGPSLARSPGEFKAKYGTDAELLDLANSMLKVVESRIVGAVDV